MNAEVLLKHFDRIAEAPDAVARLRRFVLDLAVRGKLVEQDPADGSAGKLLTQIDAEKVRLVAEGRIKKPRKLADEASAPPVFAIPTVWRWVRLDAVGAIVGGGTPSASDPENFAEPGRGIPWLTPADLGSHTGLLICRGARDLTQKGLSSSSATVMPEGTVLFTSRAPIGYVAVAANPIATNQGFKSIVPFVGGCSRYIALAMRAFAPAINEKAPGTTFKEVSGKVVASLPFPLPPLMEQHRIVAKVDELMALCDELEAARVEREARRDRLVAASLHRLQTAPATADEAADADEPALPLPAAARFHLDRLPRLVTRIEHVKQLRQVVLDLAVRGRLVPQDSGDEPAQHLLERARMDAREYARAHGVRAPAPEPLNEADTSLRLPDGWVRARLWSLFRVITDGDHQPPPRSQTGIAFLTIGNVSGGQINFADCRYVPESYFNALPEYRKPAQGDLLYTVVGATYGRPVLVDTGRPFCVQRHIAILKPSAEVDVRFLHMLLSSPLVYQQASASVTGAAQPTLALRPLRGFTVAVPPLAEQGRIVEKVDQLMALCDQLEAQLASTEADSRSLLEAVLREALQPAQTEMKVA
jgi:type I restriction enzyme S subunit